MSNPIRDSRAQRRAQGRLLSAEGIAKAWESLDLGWSWDDLVDYFGEVPIPAGSRGTMLGMAATTGILAVERDRDRATDEAEDTGEFVETQREDGVVPPHGGDRIWGTLRGSSYCVLVSHDPFPDGTRRWHISVSNEAHLKAGHDTPVWRDFRDIVHQLKPHTYFVLGIPPRDTWMNTNPNVLHAVETHDHALIEVWRLQAEVVRGTDAAVPS